MTALENLKLWGRDHHLHQRSEARRVIITLHTQKRKGKYVSGLPTHLPWKSTLKRLKRPPSSEKSDAPRALEWNKDLRSGIEDRMLRLDMGRGPRVAVVKWLDYSLPTKANRAQSPAGSLQDPRLWELCRTMPLVSGFSRESRGETKQFSKETGEHVCAVARKSGAISCGGGLPRWPTFPLLFLQHRHRLSRQHTEREDWRQSGVSTDPGRHSAHFERFPPRRYNAGGGMNGRQATDEPIKCDSDMAARSAVSTLKRDPREYIVLQSPRVFAVYGHRDLAGYRGDLRKKYPPTSGIVLHDSRVQKSVSDSAGNRTRFALPSDCLPPTKANRVKFPAGSLPDFRTCYVTVQRIFSTDLPFPSPLHSSAAPYSPHFTLIGSQDLAVMSLTLSGKQAKVGTWRATTAHLARALDITFPLRPTSLADGAVGTTYTDGSQQGSARRDALPVQRREQVLLTPGSLRYFTLHCCRHG
ncbi:hypothetical protein PR048_027595 [Dryococelus australis]|uniref:Uncharacterized protein n=1 Tax=Dryococelus australis TaxID=614101 RepID=A0ABQ9GGY8_9NEOP|nr:hypothetical protein PR048_027595 [Dryococelus australis]